MCSSVMAVSPPASTAWCARPAGFRSLAKCLTTALRSTRCLSCPAARWGAARRAASRWNCRPTPASDLWCLPKFPELKNNNNRSPMQPVVARLPVEHFPDDPTALESLDAIYLNSEKALEMKVSQAAALLAWLHQGGHLILGVEQPSDLNANSWLRPLLPCEPANISSLKTSREIVQWLSTGDTQEFEMSRQRGGPGPRATRPDRGKPITNIGYPAG